MNKFLQTVAAVVRGKPSRPAAFVLADKIAAQDAGALPSDKLEKLRALETEWRRLWVAVNVTFTDVAARKAYTQRQPKLGSELRDDGKGAETSEGWATLRDDYAARQQAARLEMVRVSTEADKLCRPICKRMLTAAEDFYAAREKAEAAEARELGFEPQPSVVLFALRRFITQLKNRATAENRDSNSAPADKLFFVESLQPKN